MNFSDNSKILEGLAFEKAIMEILKTDNPDFQHNLIEKNYYKFNAFYDAVFYEQLNLQSFGLETIYGNRIVVEIKAGRCSYTPIINFINNVEGTFDAVVFFLTGNKPKNIEEKISMRKIAVHFIDITQLKKNKDIKELLEGFDDYIVKENNLLFEDNYKLLHINKNNLAFALGAGCSINSNISNWSTLCKALGYELLYNLCENEESVYKNKLLTDELNKTIFSCYEKNSAIDAIYNSYISSASVTQSDYWLSIKKVLYMFYDSPADSNNKLLNSIVNCIKRKSIDSIINYNFDSVLEQNINPNYKSRPDEIMFSKTNLINCDIFHVHGYIPYDYNGKVEVGNFVFTDKDYYENMTNPNSFCNKIQSRIINSKNVIFVGVSFTDANIKQILRSRLEKGSRNYIFGFIKLPSFEMAGTCKKLVENKYKFIQECYFNSLGVKILWVNDYNEIPEKIDAI